MVLYDIYFRKKSNANINRAYYKIFFITKYIQYAEIFKNILYNIVCREVKIKSSNDVSDGSELRLQVHKKINFFLCL